MTPTRSAAPRVVAVLAFVASACTMSGSDGTRRPLPLHSVMVNGQAIAADDRLLLDMLRSRVGPHSLGQGGTHPGDDPQLVIDGVRVSEPMKTLATIWARDVAEVITLRPVHARARYGSEGRNGAIIVRMRRH